MPKQSQGQRIGFPRLSQTESLTHVHQFLTQKKKLNTTMNGTYRIFNRLLFIRSLMMLFSLRIHMKPWNCLVKYCQEHRLSET